MLLRRVVATTQQTAPSSSASPCIPRSTLATLASVTVIARSLRATATTWIPSTTSQVGSALHHLLQHSRMLSVTSTPAFTSSSSSSSSVPSTSLSSSTTTMDEHLNELSTFWRRSPPLPSAAHDYFDTIPVISPFIPFHPPLPCLATC
jgi:hypothetical protein